MFLKNIISDFFNKITLINFNFKKSYLGLSFKQLRPFRSEMTLREVWDETNFPNYKNLLTPTSTTKTNSSEPRLSSIPVKSTYSAYLSSRLSMATYTFGTNLERSLHWLLNAFRRSIGEGIIYIRGLAILFFFDAMLTDDEPLWDPVEWSLVQSWILFIFAFAWIAENLISSRYGSYTGRDKRVWVAWYKTFWLIEGYYVLTLGAAALFVITPFYHETTYMLPLVVSWWNWYSRVFFFKFITVYSFMLYVGYYLQLTLGNIHWRRSLFLTGIITLMLSYMLYTHFLMSFFAYFTDPNWYHSTRLTDYIQLSHEPNKWSWGNSKRDHFSYHNSKTVFWFKNDGPFAAAFLLFHILFFLCLFSLYLYWVTLFRRIYSTREITFTYTNYCVSGLRQFFYFFFFLYALVFFSFVVQYWRLPIEYAWVPNGNPLVTVLGEVLTDYPAFIFNSIL